MQTSRCVFRVSAWDRPACSRPAQALVKARLSTFQGKKAHSRVRWHSIFAVVRLVGKECQRKANFGSLTRQAMPQLLNKRNLSADRFFLDFAVFPVIHQPKCGAGDEHALRQDQRSSEGTHPAPSQRCDSSPAVAARGGIHDHQQRLGACSSVPPRSTRNDARNNTEFDPPSFLLIPSSLRRAAPRFLHDPHGERFLRARRAAPANRKFLRRKAQTGCRSGCFGRHGIGHKRSRASQLLPRHGGGTWRSAQDDASEPGPARPGPAGTAPWHRLHEEPALPARGRARR
jgi:hypothetical protein